MSRDESWAWRCSASSITTNRKYWSSHRRSLWRVRDNHLYLVIFLFRLLSQCWIWCLWISLMILSSISSAEPDWFPFEEPLSTSCLYILTEDKKASLTTSAFLENFFKSRFCCYWVHCAEYLYIFEGTFKKFHKCFKTFGSQSRHILSLYLIELFCLFHFPLYVCSLQRPREPLLNVLILPLECWMWMSLNVLHEFTIDFSFP